MTDRNWGKKGFQARAIYIQIPAQSTISVILSHSRGQLVNKIYWVPLCTDTVLYNGTMSANKAVRIYPQGVCNFRAYLKLLQEGHW